MPKNNDKLKELLEQAEQGTKAVFESENYRNYLATMSKFHSYSFITAHYVDSFGFENLPEFAQDIEDQQQEADVASFEKYQGISSEEARRHEELLDTVRFDGDIDLDREKTREQLGFRDQNKEQPKAAQEPQKKISMKERMAAAQAEADRRNSSHALNQPQRDKTAERGE